MGNLLIMQNIKRKNKHSDKCLKTFPHINQLNLDIVHDFTMARWFHFKQSRTSPKQLYLH